MNLEWAKRPVTWIRRSLAGVGEQWSEPGDARAVAIYRFLIFGFIAQTMPASLPQQLLDASEISWRPRSFYALFDLRLPSAETGTFLITVASVAGLLAALGCAYRVTAPIAAFLALYWYGQMMNFGKTLHTYYVFSIVAVALSFARAADAWSLDALARRLIARFRGVAFAPPARDKAYSWPLVFAGSCVLVMYGAAGLTKLDESGLRWAFSDNMLNLLARQNAEGSRGILVAWLREHPNLCVLVGLSGLCIEVGAWAGLLNRTAFWICGWLSVALQFGIWFLMSVHFHALQYVFAVFIPWNFLLARGDDLWAMARRALASSMAR